jgi:L-ascorbate 6-phosphate lactonase
MMTRLAQRIKETRVAPGCLAIFWIGQAGFVYKSPAGTVLYVDPYLSDSVARLLPHVGYGFKRIMATTIESEEVEADFVAVTHLHEDHYDRDAIPILGRDPHLHFIGAPDCEALFEHDAPAGGFSIMHLGETRSFADFSLTAVYADHGEAAPLALGYVVSADGINVWQTGDTAFRPDRWQEVFKLGIDVLVPPINGAYGNLNGVEAAKLAHAAGVKVAIPCHFWTFAEHHGDPGEFLDACKQFAPEVKPLLMAQGELFVATKE